MALAMSLTTTVGGTKTFAKMADGTGRFCAGFRVGAPTVEVLRHHIRGVAGNITVRDDRSGLVFTVEMLYCNTTDALVYADFAADAWNWAYQPVTLVDPGSVSFANCNLIPGSARIIRWGTDGAGKGEILAAAQFTWDG